MEKFYRIIAFLWHMVFFVIALFLFSQCDSGDDLNEFYEEPILDEIITERYEVVGYRMVMDTIFAPGQVGYFGYLSAWAEYDEEYEDTDEKMEKHEKAVLWYQNPVTTNFPPFVPIKNSYRDFFFNPDHLGKANIVLQGYFVVRINFPLSNDHLDIILGDQTLELNVEDIQVDIEYEIEFEGHYEGNQIIIPISFHFEKVLINTDHVYPDGKSSSDIFNLTSQDFLPPAPKSYISGISASNRTVIVQEPAKKMYPTPVTITSNASEKLYSYNLNPKFVSDSQLYTPTFTPLITNNGSSGPNCLISFIEIFGFEIAVPIETVETGVQLESVPNLQIIQYWVPLEVWRIPAGASKTVSVTTTYGWEETSGHEIATTLGFTIGPDFAQFTAELSETYSYSFTSSQSQEKTYESSFTAPADKNAVYVTWQKINEIRMVGQDGEFFHDPNYEFRSVELARIPTEIIVEYAYLFDI